jgi:uncharacterized protein (TIGR03067 family)
MRLRLLLVLTTGLGILGIAADEARNELDEFQGEWQLVSATRDGKDMPPEMVKVFRNAVKGDKFTITREGKPAEAGTMKLDPTKKPKEVDLVLAEDNRTALGIYERSGGTLKLCYAPPGKDRPKEFSAEEGTGRTLSVWRREKK